MVKECEEKPQEYVKDQLVPAGEVDGEGVQGKVLGACEGVASYRR